MAIDVTPLRAAGEALAAFGVIPQVAARLESEQARTARELYDTVVTQAPAFTASGNPDVLPELEQHLRDHLTEVCRLMAGGRPGELDFVRSHAHRLAAQKFPLDALLHAYRCLHRLLASWIREAALAAADETAQLRRVVAAVTDFTIEYTGAVGTLATSEYVLQTRALAEAEGDRRNQLLNMLLSGYDEADSRAAQLLRRAGYLEQRQSFCVAVARSVDPREMETAARAQRMLEALTDALGKAPVRVLAGVRDKLVTVIVSGTRRLSGWTAPQSLIADRVHPQLLTVGPAALIGVSNDAPSTSHIPRALNEAVLALDFASAGERVKLYSDIPFRQLLVREARDNIQSAVPAWLDALIAADTKARGSLVETLRVYADNDMNVLKTAKALSLHPNTIYARMQRIETITGRSALNYHALTEMLLAAECAEIAQ